MKGLIDKITIVLNDEERNYKSAGGRLGSVNMEKSDGWTIAGQAKVLISKTPNNDTIKCSNADLLVKLFASLKTEDREDFVEILLGQLRYDSSHALISYLPLLVLHRLGMATKAVEIADSGLRQNFGYDNFQAMLSKILRYEWNFFSDEDLEKLKLIYASPPFSYDIRDRINSIELARLEIELENVNQEINEDKEKLKQEFSKYSFPNDLSETLDKIDQKLNMAIDKFDYKGSMDLIRSFTERFYQSVAKIIDSEGEKMNEKDSNAVSNFFQKKDLISEEQGHILVALRHFLSNSGSHRLKSEPEDARLSRNMTVEFSLYILRRMEDHKIK